MLSREVPVELSFNDSDIAEDRAPFGDFGFRRSGMGIRESPKIRGCLILGSLKGSLKGSIRVL